jgi:hypothetical protein
MNRKQRRRDKALNILYVDFAFDTEGQYWWKQADGIMHGPFISEEAAKKDFETTTFGSQCIIKDGGQWDPAWDKKQ